MENNPKVEEVKKKRGRKKKEDLSNNAESILSNNITIIIEEKDNGGDPEHKESTTLKKRGRKPKGGKLLVKPPEKIDSIQNVANVILHMKCSMQDLTDHNIQMNKIVTDPLSYNPTVPPSIMTYNSDNVNMFSEFNKGDVDNKCDDINGEPKQFAYTEFDKTKGQQNVCQSCSLKMELEEQNEVDYESDIDIKDVNTKLKKLKIHLYKNVNPDKKSACFWCTYEYDNPSCYIPKYEMDDKIYGYGSFCRPECAVAYLMKENIDDSTKFERYHLLNQMYCKIYEYKKNIKPAPNPYFLLEKFYGNLTIQEYRKLLKSEHMLLVIEKPMTRILPELHEDSEDFIMNIYGGKSNQTTNQTGVYKVKRQSEKQKGPSKNSIMKENFGLS